ncbi:hemerythrin domain-containing protein [Abyssibacter sp.]|uniref:hemerythrin domain-containing protein n=1 Tax=Abyssibacter sp. TaxID=2320200 RepID=UPI0025BC55FE|nr:hemerythrin domain-containing protein [Abyssibacter sp.]MCK5859098.1 hemerythrin domain-containing protein [Abyssibacter sp.]
MSINEPLSIEAIKEDETKAHQRERDDVLSRVLEDHAEIKRRFNAISTAGSPADKREALHALIHKLVVHETAEQEVLHPLVRSADQGDDIAERRLKEERAAEELLARLEKLDVDDANFNQLMTELRDDVIEHAEAEEDNEFPKIEQAVSADTLASLSPIFRAAEAIAPTRPHPSGPTSATGNVALGPMVAIADRARDAIRQARNQQH